HAILACSLQQQSWGLEQTFRSSCASKRSAGEHDAQHHYSKRVAAGHVRVDAVNSPADDVGCACAPRPGKSRATIATKLARTGLSMDMPASLALGSTRREVVLATTSVWAALMVSRVFFYSLERLRHPDIVPPVWAHAVQGIAVWPFVVAGSYLTLRTWRNSG